MPLSSTANYEYTTTNIPAFLSKLWTLVEDENNNELIAWDPSGFSFHVYDQTRFAREILPRFFKHNNMASFIRQLNMYGFRKVNSIEHGSLRNEKEDMEFHHPYFIKDKEQFLEYIKRKVSEIKQPNNLNTINYTNQNALQHTNQQQQQQLTNSTSSLLNNLTNGMTIQKLQPYPQIKPDEINKVLDDVSAIKTKQELFDESLFTIKKENEALWKEVASLRQKHHHQQQIVNKLIHFLVHLVNPSSMTNLKRAKPLMIDSHMASSFIDGQNSYGNINTDSIIGDNTESFSITKGCTNSPEQFSLVELEENNKKLDEELSAEEVLSLSYINNNDNNSEAANKSDMYRSSVTSDEAEIETINNAKNVTQSTTVVPKSNYANNHNLKPLVKRLKTSDIQFLNNGNITKKNVQNYQIVNNLNNNSKALVLNNHHLNNNNNQIQEILNSNLFINNHNITNSNNTNENANINNDENRIIDSISLIDATSSSPSNNANMGSNSPIVSMPTSPSLNSPNLNRNIMMINEVNNSNNTNNLENNNNTDLSVNNVNRESTIVLADNNNLKRTISNSNQMNEHIESLQIDLNSIKEYLTNSTCNQPETFNAINNLFSNNNQTILDQIDNDTSYLEASSQSPIITQPNTNDLIQSDITNSIITNNINSSNQNINEKVIGNELIQYDPIMNSTDLFLNDELFLDYNENKSKVKPKIMNVQTIKLPITAQKVQGTYSPENNADHELNTPSIHIDQTNSEKEKFKWILN